MRWSRHSFMTTPISMLWLRSCTSRCERAPDVWLSACVCVCEIMSNLGVWPCTKTETLNLHIKTHTRTRTRTHTNIHTRKYTRSCTHTCTHTHAHTYANTQTHIYKQAYSISKLVQPEDDHKQLAQYLSDALFGQVCVLVCAVFNMRVKCCLTSLVLVVSHLLLQGCVECLCVNASKVVCECMEGCVWMQGRLCVIASLVVCECFKQSSLCTLCVNASSSPGGVNASSSPACALLCLSKQFLQLLARVHGLFSMLV
jgi:hypothetical protein